MTERPQALFLAGDLPWPANGGGRIATLRNLEAIASRYETDLVTLADPGVSLDLGPLPGLCRDIFVVEVPFTFGRHRIRQFAVAFASLFSLTPYRLRKFHHPALASTIARLRAMHAYDLVHVDQFGVVPAWTPGSPSTYSCQNVESDIYGLARRTMSNPLERLWSWQEAAKLRRAERRFLPLFDTVFVLAAEDGVLLRRLGVSNTVRLPVPAPRAADRDAPPAAPRILSLGTMSWYGVEDGLLWFRDFVWPRVRREVPDAEWHLVGANAGSSILRLDGIDGIKVRGYVDDLAPVLREARAAVVPLRVAGGIRIKLVELLAAGVPAVSTSVGVRGLDFADGEGCLIRDDADAFAVAVAHLLSDDDLWLRTVRSGQAYLATHHTTAAFRAALFEGIDAARRRHREGDVHAG